jgi:hypothetical protein
MQNRAMRAQHPRNESNPELLTSISGAWFAVALLAIASLAGCQAYDPALLARGETLAERKTDGGFSLRDAATEPTGCGQHPSCELAHAESACVDGSCTLVRCEAGFSDCDDNPDNGCEANLASTDNCGACGASCMLSHVTHPRCNLDSADGACAIDHGCDASSGAGCASNAPENGCEPGFSDCDGRAANGCETSLRTLSDCGACGVMCTIGDAEATCANGSCAFVGCVAGFDDCDGRGCASLANNPLHCGACSHRCDASAALCAGGRCTSLRCGSGKADCDGNASNGCEADLNAASSCGECSLSCGPYPHAKAGCDKGQCSLTCDFGFADCDKKRDNGCETDVSRPGSCGACGNDCAVLPHVVAAECAGGQCSNLTCESGFGDCDGDGENGCEQPLNTLDHCGSCGATCNPSHATGTCESGQCAISACAAHFDDCDGKADNGCEADLTAPASCGACGKACTPGTLCKNGGCSCSSGTCLGGLACCTGACVDTQSRCNIFKCQPGKSRDVNNCGGCGRKCESNQSCCAN